ncbi:hypothetical protein TNCV_652251 [Trichonephila clavipes]|nr:hypothetical protein TNCV_652251 [Trichonephila clavipes]
MVLKATNSGRHSIYPLAAMHFLGLDVTSLGPELEAGVSRADLVPLKTHRVEGTDDAKHVEAQSPPGGVVVCLFSSSPNQFTEVKNYEVRCQ